jgi:flavodoxin
MAMQEFLQKLRRPLFLTGLVFIFLTALDCVPSNAQGDTAMKTLIVYYSRTGNTKIACEALQKELGCDIIEIKDLTNREGRWGYYTAAFGSIFGTHTGIDPAKFNLSPYATIIVGSPIWAGKPSAAIRTFIAENRFDGKRVVPVFTTNVILKETSMDRTKKLIIQSGGQIAGCFQITSTENVDGEKVQRPGQLIVDDAVGIAAEIKKALIQ